jgi:putative restriction endonuclease
MSTRNTIKLNPMDLRYLLIDSLRLYSDNVIFIDGGNPYRFSINNKTYYVLIKNTHESGDGRGNQDECRIQVAKTKNFNEALSSKHDVIVLGYLADKNVFTAWNPFLMRDRFNIKQTISLYSRFTVQKKASKEKISLYTDNNNQSVISFTPDNLGLYLENIKSIHLLSELELKELVNKSNSLNDNGIDGNLKNQYGVFTITHDRKKRDPNFRKTVYQAYDNRCAMCGIQLELIEAAHIVPHAHDKGTDEVSNGVCLCALHHTAYDRALVYFDEELNIVINDSKVQYLEKMGLDGGFRKFESMFFDKLTIPESCISRPNVSNIKIANHSRGIGIEISN